MKKQIAFTKMTVKEGEFIEKRQTVHHLSRVQAKLLETIINAVKADRELMEMCCKPASGKSFILNLVDQTFDVWTERNSWDLMQGDIDYDQK